jgi:hypothetical protein
MQWRGRREGGSISSRRAAPGAAPVPRRLRAGANPPRPLQRGARRRAAPRSPQRQWGGGARRSAPAAYGAATQNNSKQAAICARWHFERDRITLFLILMQS